jgi:hypothetical protein
MKLKMEASMKNHTALQLGRIAFAILLLVNLSCSLSTAPTPRSYSTQPLPNSHPDELATDAPQDSPVQDYPVEEDTSFALEDLEVSGQLTLPEGSSISPSDLTIETLTGSYAVNDDGSFTTLSSHAPGEPQLHMAVNSEENAVLIGIFGASELGSDELSVASTAQALVLFDPAILLLPAEQRSQIAAALSQHPDYPGLEEAVSSAILDDPLDPLGDAHDDLYALGAKITAELYSQAGLILGEGQSTAFRNARPARFNLIAWIRAYLQTQVTQTVDVEDDAARGPEVVLVNKSMCYYQVEAKVNGKLWTPDGSSNIFLVRNNLYGTLSPQWPPIAFRSTYAPPVGDGALDFYFTLDKELTGVDLFFNTASTLLGIGEAGANQKHLKLFLSLKGTFLDTLKDALQAMPASAQMSYTEAVGAYSWLITYNGGKLLLAVAEAAAKEEVANAVQSGMIKRLIKFTAKKLMTPISLSYGAADSAAMIYCLGSAPANASFTGDQAFGIYPAVKATIDPPYISEEEPYEAHTFTVQMSGFPVEMDAVNYTWDFDDGTQPLERGTRLQGSSFSDAQEHSFGSGARTVSVTAFDPITNVPVARAVAVVNIGPGSADATAITPEGGQWVLIDMRRQDSPQQHLPDPQACYSSPSFGDAGFSETFGCNETSIYKGYQVSVNISWTALPEALTPGQEYTFNVSASVQDPDSGDGMVPTVGINVPGNSYYIGENTNQTYTFIAPQGNPGDQIQISINAGSVASQTAFTSGASETRTAIYEFRP